MIFPILKYLPVEFWKFQVDLEKNYSKNSIQHGKTRVIGASPLSLDRTLKIKHFLYFAIFLYLLPFSRKIGKTIQQFEKLGIYRMTSGEATSHQLFSQIRTQLSRSHVHNSHASQNFKHPYLPNGTLFMDQIHEFLITRSSTIESIYHMTQKHLASMS
jgi:hypothetical protein